jgi:hypothetical protein
MFAIVPPPPAAGVGSSPPIASQPSDAIRDALTCLRQEPLRHTKHRRSAKRQDSQCIWEAGLTSVRSRLEPNVGIGGLRLSLPTNEKFWSKTYL